LADDGVIVAAVDGGHGRVNVDMNNERTCFDADGDC
jgi:hypothetical protein